MAFKKLTGRLFAGVLFSRLCSVSPAQVLDFDGASIRAIPVEQTFQLNQVRDIPPLSPPVALKSSPVEDFIAWASQSAIQLDKADWRTVDQSKLDFLDSAVQEKRIVYLGEPHHLIHEKYDFRLMIIQHLFNLGWRNLGMEMGRSDGGYVDKYLESGDETFLWKTALYAGASSSFKEAEFDFWRAVRSISESRVAGTQRLRYFGYDVDVLPGQGYDDIRALLKDHEGASAVSQILNMTADLPGKLPPQEEVDRLEPVISYVDAHKQELNVEIGSDALDTLRLALLNLRESYRFFQAWKNRSDGHSSREDWQKALAEREKTMDREMSYLLRSQPNEKFMLMAHNMHMSKDYESLREGPVGSNPPAPVMWPSVGTYLNQLLLGKIFSIWMLYGHLKNGHQQGDPGSPAINIGNILSPVGQVFFLPLQSSDPRSQFVDQPLNFQINGNLDNSANEGTASGNIKRQADTVFMVREATPL